MLYIISSRLIYNWKLVPLNPLHLFNVSTNSTSLRKAPACSLSDQIRSDQSLSHVRLFATPWIAACQASLSITNSQSSPRLMSVKSVMPSSHLILCHLPLLLPPIPPSIRVFSTESTLRMRWPKYWSLSFSIISSKEILKSRNPQTTWG